jgi:hypothetical protein
MQEVNLQYTQEDRDMIRDTNRDVKEILVKVRTHGDDLVALAARVTKLETWQARVLAIAGFIGFLAGLASRFLPWR